MKKDGFIIETFIVAEDRDVYYLRKKISSRDEFSIKKDSVKLIAKDIDTMILLQKKSLKEKIEKKRKLLKKN